ncbi:hypothetical protein HUO13_28615 [Saccharopolyspora erythraea]|uniref:hypothetical protein n=1 Tax=Saccharopolyspora erythraea TaxID=1836 RepID=UPI001BA6F125|nr:hypothetical protein [Saccharopolyspora erythraea]QUH04228.1 hypothetical protein HUO13_28615 [Saccharopolyspora erythraea]
MSTTTHQPTSEQQLDQVRRPYFIRHDVRCEHPVGPVDKYSICSILDRLPEIPSWPNPVDRFTKHRGVIYLAGARQILEWLAEHDGEGWQARWETAGGDNYTWIDDLADGDNYRRANLVAGLRFLLLAPVFRPGYGFFRSFRAQALFDQAQQLLDADLFARLDHLGGELRLPKVQVNEGKKVLTKIALHTGKGVRDLAEQDFFELRAFQIKTVGRSARGLVAVGVAPSSGGAVGDRLFARRVAPWSTFDRGTGRCLRSALHTGP